MRKVTFYCDRCGEQISGKIYRLATYFGDPDDDESEWLVAYGAELCEKCYKTVDNSVATAIKNTAPKKKSGKEIDMGKVRALRNAGWSCEKIGEEFGVSGQTIINHLKKEESNDTV